LDKQGNVLKLAEGVKKNAPQKYLNPFFTQPKFTRAGQKRRAYSSAALFEVK
jgi:hypothetical protein